MNNPLSIKGWREKEEDSDVLTLDILDKAIDEIRRCGSYVTPWFYGGLASSQLKKVL